MQQFTVSKDKMGECSAQGQMMFVPTLITVTAL